MVLMADLSFAIIKLSWGSTKEIPPEELGQSREREPQAIRKDISRGEEYFPPKSIQLRMTSAVIEPSVIETLVRAKAS